MIFNGDLIDIAAAIVIGWDFIVLSQQRLGKRSTYMTSSDEWTSPLELLGVLFLAGFVWLGISAIQQNQADEQKNEPRDRARFEQVFGVPAYARSDLTDTEAAERAIRIRNAKVAQALIPDVDGIIAARRELAQTSLARTDTTYADQVAQSNAAKKRYDDRVAVFREDVRLARRFALTMFYDDLYEELEPDYHWSAWCFVRDRLQKNNLVGIGGLLGEDVYQVQGCGE